MSPFKTRLAGLAKCAVEWSIIVADSEITLDYDYADGLLKRAPSAIVSSYIQLFGAS